MNTGSNGVRKLAKPVLVARLKQDQQMALLAVKAQRYCLVALRGEVTLFRLAALTLRACSRLGRVIHAPNR